MKGLPLKKDAIDMKTVLFIALSSFMISNAEVSNLITINFNLDLNFIYAKLISISELDNSTEM